MCNSSQEIRIAGFSGRLQIIFSLDIGTWKLDLSYTLHTRYQDFVSIYWTDTIFDDKEKSRSMQLR